MTIDEMAIEAVYTRGFAGISIHTIRDIIKAYESSRAQEPKWCPSCGGNDANHPCAFPGEDRRGCMRDERLKSAQEAQGWMPIEGAPRNDIIILANVTPTAIWWAKAAAWNGIGWYETGTGKGLNPTHWMPLPKPPTEARQDDVVLREKYKNLVKFYDDHVGTPCEQIRHQEEIAKLQAALKQAREALKFYANPGDYKAPYTGGMGKLYFDCGTVATEAKSAIDAVLNNKGE